MRHREACTAIGSRAPPSCAPGRGGSRCTQRVEVPLHLSLFVQPSRDSKVYRNEMEPARDKKDNRPILCGGIHFFDDHLPLSQYNSGLWLCSFGSAILLPSNFLVDSRDRRFVRDPEFSFQILLARNTGFLVESSFWGIICGPDVVVM